MATDLTGIWLARVGLQAARGGTLGGPLSELTLRLAPVGSVSAMQVAAAIIVSLLFLGGYREQRWRDPVVALTATGAGVVLALYSDAWHGSASIVLGRGLLLWLVLGPIIVVGRRVCHLAAARLTSTGMRHRVLAITDLPSGGIDAEGVHLDLGPSYELVASLHRDWLPSDIEEMERWLEGGVDTIVVSGDVPPGRFGVLTDFALTHGCRLLCIPRTAKLIGVDMKRVWLGGHPMLELTAPGLRASHLVMKRALDVVLSSAALVLLSPVFLVIGIWIKLDSPGPVFFSQRRPGLRGRWFPMFKFRSMRMDAEEVLRGDPIMHHLFLENDCKLPEDQDPRLTRAGRFIRKTSLDELPQLLNVFRGEMSLVGPRPLVGPELENYEDRIPTLLSVKPGMTGLWQVSGRSSVSYPERAQMDLEYVRTWSFLGDLWILTVTPAAVLIRRGAH